MTPEIKEKLLGLINEKAYNPLKKEELALIFDIHSCEMPMFNNFLEELQDEGYLIVSKKGRVMAPSAMGYFVGKFISHRKGFGYRNFQPEPDHRPSPQAVEAEREPYAFDCSNQGRCGRPCQAETRPRHFY